jgi:hypothetical protein
MAKKPDSLYESGRRSGAWIKVKLTQEQEFVIGGYTLPEGSRKYFGALLVGYYGGKRPTLRRQSRHRLFRQAPGGSVCRLTKDPARDYPEAARRVIKAMHEQVGTLRVDENGLALRGVIVRHLVMPGLVDDTGEIVRWLAGELSSDTYLNVMDQYYPAWRAKTEAKFSEINREIRVSEFEQALATAREAGMWRLDKRWRHVRPQFDFVEIPPAD